MTEDYLQFIWKHKRILNPNLCLIDNSMVNIINFGIHNTLLKGPDFKHASILLDGLTFHGHIEIHVKSSDWYLHKHHLDENYNNVILHVVYEHDREVIQNGRKLPVIELKNLIDVNHWKKHKKYMENASQIICEKEIASIDPVFLQSMISKAIIKKMNDKVELVTSYLSEDVSPMYLFLAAAFGTHLNKYAFLELVRRIPNHQLTQLSNSQRYKLLMTESGIFTMKHNLENKTIGDDNKEINQWHFKGTRPNNFPTLRIKQFAHLIGDSDLELFVKLSTSKEIIESMNFIFDRCNNQMKDGESILSKSFKNNLIINGLVPYLWFLSEENEDDDYQEMALSILNELAPENNSILKKWKKSEIHVGNAYDSQGLIGLYRYYCCRKKCLSCEVGNKVLNN